MEGQGDKGEDLVFPFSRLLSPLVLSDPSFPFCRCNPVPTRELLVEMQRDGYIGNENGDAIDCSNFVDLDWLSSSGNSCEEELLER